MVLRKIDDYLAQRLRCLRCHSRVDINQQTIRCANINCQFHGDGYSIICEQPVMIDFSKSIISREDADNEMLQMRSIRDNFREKFRNRASEALMGPNKSAARFATRIINDVALPSIKRPTLLVIGGGAMGSGAQKLYCSDVVDVVGSDIYPSPLTSVVFDGHSIPFEDESFDGVWIQAVLEHVVDPQCVVSEIYRVLKPGGFIYADTPFMQPVHEGAYDFTRFSESGHRWLFNKFEYISAGTVGGAGTSLMWSIKYFVRAITGSSKFGTLFSYLFFWLRYFDHFGRKKMHRDAACGTYFYGRKCGTQLTAQEIRAFYSRISAPCD